MNDTTSPIGEPFSNDANESPTAQTEIDTIEINQRGSDRSEIDSATALLSDAVAEPPTPSVRQRALASLTARQRIVATPHESLVDTVGAFAALLSSITAEQFDRPALGTLTVRGLVGHTIGVDLYLIDVLQGEQPGPLDHRFATQPAIDLATRLDDEELLAWYAATSTALLHTAAGASAAQLAEPVAYFTLNGPLGAVLVARAFELWNHTDDIRRALGLTLDAPTPPTLSAMTDLAAALVPATVTDPPDATAMRLVLTGVGGGTWVRGFGAADSPDEIVTLVADAVDFCRWIGDRLEREDFDVELIGDSHIGELILAGARSLAFD